MAARICFDQSVSYYSSACFNRNINSGLEQAVTLQPCDWISVQKDLEMTGAGHGNDELMDSRQKDHGNDGILDSRPTDRGNDEGGGLRE